MRPIFANLNKAGRWFVESGKFSVDEVMIPYYGRHSSKQFIHGKPIRYGFKVRKKTVLSSHFVKGMFQKIYDIFKKPNAPKYFQVWALCTTNGEGVWFEPYCGRHTCVEDQGLGQGPNVVLQLVDKVRC
jgi:hypothetical protein